MTGMLQLRDTIPTIPYPETWCLPGDHIEGDETPEECLTREMREEMGIELPSLMSFTKKRYPGETEYFFVAQMGFDAQTIRLAEGQAIAWFSLEATQQLAMAHDDGAIIKAFFDRVESG